MSETLDLAQINTGLATFHLPEAHPEQKTVVVMGPARSGTTMIAQMLATLGIYLGERDVNLFEDIPIRRAIRERRLAHLEQVLRARDAEHDLWGWKYPETVEVLQFIREKARNPYFIFTFRDPLATSLRNKISGDPQLDLFGAMRDAMNYMDSMTREIQASLVPSLLISYEKALIKPNAVVDAICSFLELDVSEARRLDAVDQVNPGNNRYLLAKQSKRFRGNIDGINWSVIWGWAYDAQDRCNVEIELRVNGETVHREKPVRPRKDIARLLGEEEVRCGFRIDMESFLKKGQRNRVEVLIAHNQFPLINSPKFLHPESDAD